MRSRLPLSLLLFAGCATPPVTNPAELSASQAVKARYWDIQARQRHAPERTIPLVQPKHVEDGALRVPTFTEIRLP